jgi:hypothetical protein
MLMMRLKIAVAKKILRAASINVNEEFTRWSGGLWKERNVYSLSTALKHLRL